MFRNLRQVQQQLGKASTASTDDFFNQSLALLRELSASQNIAAWRGSFQKVTCRNFAKLPGSDPAPSVARFKRAGTRKGLPAQQASGTEASTDNLASNIATMQRDSAATGTAFHCGACPAPSQPQQLHVCIDRCACMLAQGTFHTGLMQQNASQRS